MTKTAKAKTVYVCSACGYECGKWMGKCPSCGEWKTMAEEIVAVHKAESVPVSLPLSERAQPVGKVRTEHFLRVSSGIGELDLVLGGGIVPSSFVLCGGDPGIGKSTLLLQMANYVAQKDKVLYVSAEESAQQVRMRADRIGAHSEQLYILAQTEMNEILAQLEAEQPKLAIIDSVQTVYLSEMNSAQGSVSQVRECASRLMRYAKSHDCAVFLVGHVTKEGAIAGPKVLEHIVDTVLYFEGEKNNTFRILRAVKNRFGSSNEIGVFQMLEEGMVPVPNPSEELLNQSQHESGSAVFCSMEGTRPIACEIQALTGPSVFAVARRSATGVDYNRLAMLLAVLEKKLGYALGAQDVYVNVAGGIRLEETAADLPVLAAVASSCRNQPIPRGTVLIGEVGLTGELRSVGQVQRRVQECMKLGFERIIMPKNSCKGLSKVSGIEILGVQTLREALKLCFKQTD